MIYAKNKKENLLAYARRWLVSGHVLVKESLSRNFFGFGPSIVFFQDVLVARRRAGNVHRYPRHQKTRVYNSYRPALIVRGDLDQHIHIAPQIGVMDAFTSTSDRRNRRVRPAHSTTFDVGDEVLNRAPSAKGVVKFLSEFTHCSLLIGRF